MVADVPALRCDMPYIVARKRFNQQSLDKSTRVATDADTKYVAARSTTVEKEVRTAVGR
jgi:hypothetical protein